MTRSIRTFGCRRKFLHFVGNVCVTILYHHHSGLLACIRLRRQSSLERTGETACPPARLVSRFRIPYDVIQYVNPKRSPKWPLAIHRGGAGRFVSGGWGGFLPSFLQDDGILPHPYLVTTTTKTTTTTTSTTTRTRTTSLVRTCPKNRSMKIARDAKNCSNKKRRLVAPPRHSNKNNHYHGMLPGTLPHPNNNKKKKSNKNNIVLVI